MYMYMCMCMHVRTYTMLCHHNYVRHMHVFVHTFTAAFVLFCSVMYEEFIKEFKGSGLKFEQVPFNHPLFIMYSSGTTGTPKCMVHSVGVSRVKQCLVWYVLRIAYTVSVHLHVPSIIYLLHFHLQGTLIQHLKEHILHGNMTSNDVIFYYSTVSIKSISIPPYLIMSTFPPSLALSLSPLSLPLPLLLDWLDDVELVSLSSGCWCYHSPL